jgi:hypothetical protein
VAERTCAANGPQAGGGAGPLPRADVLVVTWTMDEGHALSRELTPGKNSNNDYVPYTHNYASIASGTSRAHAKRRGARGVNTPRTTEHVASAFTGRQPLASVVGREPPHVCDFRRGQ